MEVKKYGEFINESKKDDAQSEIIKMLEDKPTVTMSSEKWPTEKGIYSQAGIIKFLKGKFSNNQVLNALHDIKNDKKIGLKSIKVKNFEYNENYPYYYLGLSESEAKDIKDKYEEKNEIDNKKTINKRAEAKSAAKKASKKVTKKPVTKKIGPKKIEARKATK
jgi:hypothetical protein